MKKCDKRSQRPLNAIYDNYKVMTLNYMDIIRKMSELVWL